MPMGILRWLSVAAALWLLGCGEELSQQPTLELLAHLERSTVTSRTLQAPESPAALPTVDSLRIERVRVLISRILLQPNGSDTTSARSLRLTPLLALFGPTPQLLLLEAPPPGSYRWLKFELHRFTESERREYSGNPTLADFLAEDRPSIILEGTLYRGDSAVAFAYRSTVTANVALALEPPLQLSRDTLQRLLLRFDPATAFVQNGRILDPRVPEQRAAIENALRAAFKAVKSP